ncbi:MAG: protealysin inhibitor emfourin [Myxococcota bacterium]
MKIRIMTSGGLTGMGLPGVVQPKEVDLNNLSPALAKRARAVFSPGGAADSATASARGASAVRYEITVIDDAGGSRTCNFDDVGASSEVLAMIYELVQQ